MKTLKLNLKDNSYNIYFEKKIIYKIPQYFKENYSGKKIAIITDHNIEKLYRLELNRSLNALGLESKIISVKPGEESKSLETLQEIYYELSKFKFGRRDLIITLGGGVVGDLGGFAASTYLRGVDYIQVPTSLLAQVDSSIGGKVAIDLPWGKNLVGSFYHPKAVFIDSDFLKTLDRRFLHDGLAEVIKYGFIRDESIVHELMKFNNDEELLTNIEDIIYKCCSIKKRVVEKDEKDFGERMLLNFGHTLGHAVERYFDYKKYSHGEAVAIGMVQITRKSEILSLTQKGTSKLLEEVLNKYSLPIETPNMDRKSVLDAVVLDKKSNRENINLIIIKKIGEGIIKEVSISDIGDYI
ncbi:MAG: 3-dehydroquinate synthase [Clostridiales bacterium]|jgi:3-dehydroquinate synthase|nr:3-dehydroquinate synthase [Clostridiales bacterium]